MKRILITGARAPVALDLIRRFSKAGLEVYVADTMNFPLSRGSKYLIKYFKLPSPSLSLKAFEAKLNLIIKEYKIDILFPTCEEVFYISKIRNNLQKECFIFCDSFKKISNFHNKYTFLKLVKDRFIIAPNTQIVYDIEEINKIENINRKVLKPVYSRFGKHTIICPQNYRFIEHINISKTYPWVVQDFIMGQEVCTYSIAINGKLLTHSCYEPTFKVGIGSSMFFTPIQNPYIKDFIENFVKEQNFTGQIGFDFIISSESKIYVLECNPRATSGLHCLDENIDLKKMFTEPQFLYQNSPNNSNLKRKMIFLAMICFGGKYLFSNSRTDYLKSIFNTDDIIWDKSDLMPLVFQAIGVLEILLKAIYNRQSLLEAATSDIEWDGTPL